MTTNDDHDLNVEAILEVLEAAHAGEEPVVAAGLRERKKHRARQRISNVATALFLAEGFDDVTVARIAALSEVSEQTVFNYFPTKESMFFDRSESNVQALADAVRHRGREALSDVVMDALFGGLPLDRWAGQNEVQSLRLFRRFCEVAESSQTLREAPYIELEGFTATVGTSLAERIGRDAGDPEVELAAIVIAGLSRVWALATYRHVQRVSSLAALERAVRADVTRAAQLAAPTLDAFDKLDSRPQPGTVPQPRRSQSRASAADHV
jgi:AcrR family transcriptional regulator